MEEWTESIRAGAKATLRAIALAPNDTAFDMQFLESIKTKIEQCGGKALDLNGQDTTSSPNQRKTQRNRTENAESRSKIKSRPPK